MCNLCHPYECDCGRVYDNFYDASHCPCREEENNEEEE